MERTPLTLDELKRISLDILLHIDAFCRERDIPYFLAYGTALGTVRHGGFIPWDDDIDLVMRREDYERFLKEFSDPEGRYVCLSFEEGTYTFPFAKIVDSRTEQFPKNMKPVAGMGVGVDVFPFDTFASSDRKRVLKQKKRASAIFKRLRYTCYNSLSEINSERFLPAHTLFYLWCNLWGTKFYQRKLSRYMKRMRGDGPFCAMAVAMDTDIKHVYDKHLLDARAEYDFEGHTFYSFADIHAYLRIAYGESYMTPPPPEKRTAHYAEAFYKEEGARNA